MRVITNSTLCLGLEKTHYCLIDLSNKQSNVCNGDSGGPMMFFMNGKWHVYGVASFVFGDPVVRCDNTKPSFYTRVPSFLKWISKNKY